MSVLYGLPGSYVAEALAGTIEQWQRWPSCVWLRVADPQPAAVAGALVDACRFRWPDVADTHDPGARPAALLAGAIRHAPRDSVIVLELGGRVTRGVGRLLRTVRADVAERGVSLVVVAESLLPGASSCRPDRTVAAADLVAVEEMVEDAGLPTRCRDRLIARVGGRPAVVHDVLAAAAGRPDGRLVDALDRALDAPGGWRSVLDRLTVDLLADCTPQQRAALEMCVTTGYWHPQLVCDAVPATGLRPWMVPLEDQWGWLRPVWARSLRRCVAGGDRARPGPARPGGAPTVAVAAPHATMEARLFGTFEIRVDGQTVQTWNGRRGVDVLRFLIARPQHACSRDVILDEFWPDVAPAVARNRLQVAVSGLRRALSAVTNLQVVEYFDGGYRISPALRLDVDVERFEQALSVGRRAERAGDRDGALAAYREAIEEYRGDFAADAPYGQWTLLPRESMRLAYIEALDRVSRILLRAGRIDECVATALRMLEIDPCREDAHRLLMRCYAHQGRSYQALRQYDFCRRILHATLGARPDLRTTRLYHAVRAGSALEPALTE